MKEPTYLHVSVNRPCDGCHACMAEIIKQKAVIKDLLEALEAMYAMDWRIGPTKKEYLNAFKAIKKAQELQPRGE